MLSLWFTTPDVLDGAKPRKESLDVIVSKQWRQPLHIDCARVHIFARNLRLLASHLLSVSAQLHTRQERQPQVCLCVLARACACLCVLVLALVCLGAQHLFYQRCSLRFSPTSPSVHPRAPGESRWPQWRE